MPLCGDSSTCQLARCASERKRALACLQVFCLTLSVVKEQSLSANLVRLEKELFPLYLLW